MYTQSLSDWQLDEGQIGNLDPPQYIPAMGRLSSLKAMLLGLWLILALIGLVAMFLFHSMVLGVIIIAIPTFIGMIISPVFGLSVVMMVLPTGAGIGAFAARGATLHESFSLDRGVGLALAVSFALNAIITRPRFRLNRKVIWAIVVYTFCVSIASVAGQYLSLELRMAFSQIQLLIMVLIILWIIGNYGEAAYRWALRSYVLGTVMMIVLTFLTGAAIRSVDETSEGRYAATLGRAIDANMLAAIVAMAFFAALYLFIRDRSLFWRVVHAVAILMMPLMLLRIGSRGALVAVMITFLLPLIFMRQLCRRPSVGILVLGAAVLAVVLFLFFFRTGHLEEHVSQRLTDVNYAEQSIAVRMEPIKQAIKVGLRRPLGTGYYSWFARTSARIYPHNDFFFLFGVRGPVCAGLFALILLMMIMVVRRTPLTIEKIYSRAVLTFLIVMGLNIGQVYKKYFWIFLAFVLASEAVARLHAAQEKSTSDQFDEETPYTDY